MPTYLMTWNSNDRYAWPRMKTDAEIVALGDQPEMNWRCGHSKTIKKDDRLILFRQGHEPRGVIGTGTAIGDWRPYEAGGPKQPTRTKNEVRIRIETLIDPDIHEPLTVAEMNAAGVTGVTWNVQASGMRVPEEAADRIVELWLPRSNSTQRADELTGIEGEVTYRMVLHRKREHRLRNAAIDRALRERGSLKCEVPRCHFDFLDRYGEKGRGFSHVHHLLKLADRNHPSKTRLSDLAIVCANCHAMIHLGGGSRDMDTLIPETAE